MTPMPPDEHRMESGRAPTPFSADQIREACSPGRLNVYRIEEQGSPDVVLHWEFVGGDEDGGDSVSQAFGPDGDPLGEPSQSTSPWRDLQAHASYPEDATEITEEAVTVPAGAFDCWLYTVQDGRIVGRAWFAKDLPGPPVLKIDTVDGETVASMTLLEVTRPGVDTAGDG